MFSGNKAAQERKDAGDERALAQSSSVASSQDSGSGSRLVLGALGIGWGWVAGTGCEFGGVFALIGGGGFGSTGILGLAFDATPLAGSRALSQADSSALPR